MTGSATAVLVMARAPIPGRVKTRLEPLLGPHGCAQLQEQLIAHTIATAQQAFPGSVYLALTPGGPPPPGTVTRPGPAGVRLLGQRGSTLGQRMVCAVADVLQHQSGPVVVIGTDAPTLGPGLLTRASALLHEGRDVVFGPALDGGYYLVGVARSLPQLFAIDAGLWGGPQVLTASLARAASMGLQVGTLATLRDLDTPQDAAALRASGVLPPSLDALLNVAAEPA